MEVLTKTKEKEAAQQVDPSKIMQIGMGFWASKTLLTAVKMELFTLLGEAPLTVTEIKNRLKLHDRGIYDFLDTLVALGFLQRQGIKSTARYANSPETDLFLDKRKQTYMGGILERANNRLYTTWEFLEEGLKTGKPQNLSKHDEGNVFEAIYANEDSLREFIRAMSGVQAGNFIAFANQFNFSEYTTLCDIGGAGALLSAQVVFHNPHMKCITFDLPKVSSIANENVKAMNLDKNIEIQSGDFFKDTFPAADVITMGNILHDWGTKEKLTLIRKSYEALPRGGALVVIENIIDNDRKENAFGLMMSLNMLLETQEGYDFTGEDFDNMAKECGFIETYVMPLAGPSSAAIAIK